MYVKLGLQILYVVGQFSSLLFKVICVYAVKLSSKLFHCTSFWLSVPINLPFSCDSTFPLCSRFYGILLKFAFSLIHTYINFIKVSRYLAKSRTKLWGKKAYRSLSSVRKAGFDVICQANMGEAQRTWASVKWDVSLNKFSWYDPWRRCYWFVRSSAIFPYYEEDEVKKVKYHSICHKLHITL